LFGLIGSPGRRAAIQAMSDRLEAPDGAIDRWFLEDLARLVLDRDGTLDHPAAIPGRRPHDDFSAEQWRRYDLSTLAIVRQLGGRLLAALPRKTGRARATAALTLLELTEPPCCFAHDQLPAVEPRLADTLRQEIAASFAELPAARQHELLALRWGALRGPAMTAALRRLLAAPPSLPWIGGESLESLALRRLHEMAPAEATALLLERARRPVPEVGLEALGLLPAEAVSSLETEIVSHLEAVPPDMAGMGELSFLVARYATPAVLPRVRAYYETRLNEWMCWQAPFIAYFLRVEPALGKAKLEEVLDTPPKPRHPRCAPGLLPAVGKLFYSPALESVAISHLDDPNHQVAAEAAAVLGGQGSPAAAAPLWHRLERWQAQWEGRSRELLEASAERSLGSALRDAIALSPAWLVDSTQLERLRDLGVGPDATSWLQNLLGLREVSGKVALGVTLDADGKPEFTIAHYRLHSMAAAKAKLDQFPSGAVFAWISYSAPAATPQELALRAELATYLKARGLEIER
jgi:hypothetical protein